MGGGGGGGGSERREALSASSESAVGGLAPLETGVLGRTAVEGRGCLRWISCTLGPVGICREGVKCCSSWLV